MNPAPRTEYSTGALIRRGRALAGNCAAVSFDVFDTLLVRRVHDPDLLKRATARLMARLAAEAGQPGWPAARVQRLRDRVERLHRRRAGRAGPDHEACYPDFMRDTLRIVLGRPDVDEALAQVSDYELRIESAMLAARAPLLDWVRELKAAGKRLLAVSDIYLTGEQVARLLDGAGFAGLFDRVVSSADTGLAKASGAGWDRLLREEAAAPEAWLHVGDNPVSDGARPAERGIRALVLRDAGEIRRRAVARAYWQAAERGRPVWQGRLLQQWMMPLEAENAPVDPLYAIGYTFFAPLFCGFVQHVAERCLEERLERVFFFSREGRLLLDLWNALTPLWGAGAALPPARYLHVSRMALAQTACAVDGLTPANARFAFRPATNRDFRDIARVYGLSLAPLEPFLRLHGLRPDTPLSHWLAPPRDPVHRRLDSLLRDGDFQAEVRRQTAPALEALRRYLAEAGLLGAGRVAVVDVGWHGTIQRYLYESLRGFESHPALHGFLVSCIRGVAFPEAPDNRIEGYIFDHRRFSFAGSFTLCAQDIFEEAARAPEPGLLGYAPDGDGYRLVFRPDNDACAQREREQDAYYAPLQAGIRDAARRFAAASAVTGWSAKAWKPWLNAQLVARIAFPRTREVERLTRIHHLDDFARAGAPAPRARRHLRHLWNRPLWALRLNPALRLWYYLRQAVWALRQ